MAKRKVERYADQSMVLLRGDELSEAHQAAAMIEEAGGQVLHIFGPRMLIGRIPARARAWVEGQAEVRSLHADAIGRAPEPRSETEQLGLEAWNLRQSEAFAAAKTERPRDEERWDAPDMIDPPDGPGMRHVGESGVLGAPEMAVEDMSPYLIGSVAIGILLVEGPTAALQFSDAERTKVVAEVQEGLTWLGRQEPRASITWSYDIRTIRINTQPDPNLSGYEPLESLWRNPAMAKIGFSPTFQGVRDYVASTRTSLGTRWGYVAFFTKYPVHHFAYASKPRLVMHYDNDGWGPDNIDRVFTHESGHIFGCPDEYSSSDCNCTARYGYLQEVNGNCERCASPFTSCLMAANTWATCRYTPIHLGWRDSDGDDILDPVDPASSPVIDRRRLCRRFPSLCGLLNLHASGLAPQAADSSPHESVPLFLLRRVLAASEMAKVEAALSREEDQYLEALQKKFNTAAKDVERLRRLQTSTPRGRRSRS